MGSVMRDLLHQPCSNDPVIMNATARFAAAQFTVVRILAAAAVLGWMSWFSAGAKASCGDYVLIHDLHAPHSASPQASHLPMNGERDVSTLPVSSHRSAPCRGPHCSKRSVPPLDPSPAPAFSLERHDWSWSAPEIAPAQLASSRFHSLEACPRPLFLGQSIFRPPRSGAPALA